MNRLIYSLLGLSLLVTSSSIGFAEDKEGDAKKPAAKTKTVAADGLELSVPETWKKKEVAGGMRKAQLEIPPVGDDKEPGEFVVFYFGPEGAGGVPANIERWIGQIEEEGRKVKITTGDSKLGKYTVVDLTGTYNKSIGPPIAGNKKKLPGWRVMNVAIETEKGPYYLKLDGPAKTIAAVEDELRASFGGKKESEKERKQ